jgi:hypothetical protein
MCFAEVGYDVTTSWIRLSTVNEKVVFSLHDGGTMIRDLSQYVQYLS